MAATLSPSLASVGTGHEDQGAGAAIPHHQGPAEASDVEKLAPSTPPSQPPAGGAQLPPRPSDEELFQPRSVRFWLTLLCNFLALFLVALDRTIIATAVPRISDEFKSLGDIGWYGSAYMLTTACAQLLFGRIYKFYHMKWAFLSSIVIFEAGSAICGAAPNSTAFIVGRAIAGFGSAGIFSGCLLIMIPMIPLHRRPAFQGLFGMVFGIASVLGPLVGGGFTGGVTWRWCFYINLPIGAVALGFMVFFWNPPEYPHKPVKAMVHFKRLDPLGMFFFLPGVICLFTAFQWGGSTYDWNDWRIIVLLVMFAVCSLAFIAVQILKPETASVPPRVIMQRSVAFGTGFTFFLAGSMLMLVYFVPIWFQTVKQVNPIRSGIYTLPLVLSLVFSSIASGGITQKIGYYVPSMLLAPTLMSIGEGLLTTLDRDSPTAHWVAYQFLAGFGLGFGMQTSGLAIQAVLPREDISTGIAINFFVQQLGGAVFTSVGQAILTNELVAQLSALPGFDPKAIVNDGATRLAQSVPPEDARLVVDAYNAACRHIFFSAMGLAFASLLCAFGMEWRCIKKVRQGPPPGGKPSPASTAPSTSTAPLPTPATGPIPGRPFFDGMHSRSGFYKKSKSSKSSKSKARPKSKEERKSKETKRHSLKLTKPAPLEFWGDAGRPRSGATARARLSLPPDEDLDGVLAMWAKYSRATAQAQTSAGEKGGWLVPQEGRETPNWLSQEGGEMRREEVLGMGDMKKRELLGMEEEERKREAFGMGDEKKRELFGLGNEKMRDVFGMRGEKEKSELPKEKMPGKQETGPHEVKQEKNTGLHEKRKEKTGLQDNGETPRADEEQPRQDSGPEDCGDKETEMQRKDDKNDKGVRDA